MPSTFRGAVNAGGRQANKFTGNALKLTQIKMTTKQSSGGKQKCEYKYRQEQRNEAHKSQR